MRKGTAWAAALKLDKVWKSKYILRSTKIGIFIACVESVLLYNATTWTLNESLKLKLDGQYTKLLRYALNYKWSDYVSNNTLYGTGLGYKNSLRPISMRLQERRLTWLGHCWRSQESARQPVSDVMFWQSSSKRKIGRPSDTFISVLKRDMQVDQETDISTIKELMNDRDTWIDIVKARRTTQWEEEK